MSPANSMQFTWHVPPSAMVGEIEVLKGRMLVAVKAVADFICTKMQNESRTGAPWQDRTGNARSGLFSVATMVAKDVVEMYLSHGHTIFYGEHLELSHGQKYAIVMPTILSNLGDLESMLQELFR